MVFSEPLKLAVKKKAHFCCCLCHSLGIEVHHILPQADGGEDSEENAAPLCPSCHETYGANAQKRKFIREAREFWYELCSQRYATDPDRLDEISEQLKRAATKADLDAAISKLTQLMHTAAGKEDRPVQDRVQEVARLGSMILTAPTPDVRVTVTAALVYLGAELEKVLSIAVQNHSPVTVFVASISIALKDGMNLFMPRDSVTGEQNRRHVLQPGESYTLRVSPELILEKTVVDDVLFAFATDDIGRKYRSGESDIKRCIRQLAGKSAEAG